MACASLLTADERANRARGSAERANLHRHKLESGGHLSRSSTLSGEWKNGFAWEVMKRPAPDVASGKSVHATLLKLAVPLGTTPGTTCCRSIAG
jgi:hypothetical protein